MHVVALALKKRVGCSRRKQTRRVGALIRLGVRRLVREGFPEEVTLS